jgi:hypothetical protein
MLLRQLRSIPAATQRANKANAGNKLSSLQVESCALILQQSTLSSQYFKITRHATFVTLV